MSLSSKVMDQVQGLDDTVTYYSEEEEEYPLPEQEVNQGSYIASYEPSHYDTEPYSSEDEYEGSAYPSRQAVVIPGYYDDHFGDDFDDELF